MTPNQLEIIDETGILPQIVPMPGASMRLKFAQRMEREGRTGMLNEAAAAVDVTRETMLEMKAVVVKQQMQLEEYERLLSRAQNRVVTLEQELKQCQAALQTAWDALGEV